MARGKYAARAAIRDEATSRETEITTYQRAVARLTRERDEAKQKLAEEQKRNRAAERELRARLEQAASPQVEARDLQIASLKEALARVQRACKQAINDRNEAAQDVVLHYMNVHAMSHAEAMALVSDAFGISAVGRLERNEALRSEDSERRERSALWDLAMERAKERSARVNSEPKTGRLG